MGLHDRTYWKEDGGSFYQGGGGGHPGGRMGFGGMPKPGPAVKWLLITNVAVFFFQLLPNVSTHLALIPRNWWFVWNYMTFQFLHGSPIHLLFNMIGLYFLGMVLERAWGIKRFVIFYFACGVFAGVCHIVLTFALGEDPSIPLVGASGGVYGIIVACAILFPQIRLVLLFFLVPIRFVAVLFLGLAVYYIFEGAMRGGVGGGIAHGAHLGGAVMAAVWVWVLPRFRGAAQEAKLRRRQGAWDRKMKQRADEQTEIDRILAKIHDQGINSLSAREKNILQKATRKQQAEEDRAHRL